MEVKFGSGVDEVQYPNCGMWLGHVVGAIVLSISLKEKTLWSELDSNSTSSLKISF